VAFVVIFFLVLTAGGIFTYVIKKIILIGPLKSIDRILGGVFGFLRGVLIAGIVIIALSFFAVDTDMIKRSQLSGTIMKAMKVFLVIIPDHYKKEVDFLMKNEQ
jgi:membrane protein required for colicin V production